MTDPASRPLGLCFVIIPYGRKSTPHGEIDFDALYANLHEPAIRAAGLEPLRADREMVGGIIHKAMFERLVLCRFALVDLTVENANVYYELGLRHACREYSTVATFVDGTRLPFDLGMWRGVPYGLDRRRRLADAAGARAAVQEALAAATSAQVDSPLFQLLDGMRPPDISRLKTDVFSKRVDYAQSRRAELDAARKGGKDGLMAFRRSLGPLHDDESGLLVDLMLALRDVKAWPEMIAFVGDLDPALQRTVLVREQLALALNRQEPGSTEAERVLRELIHDRGTASETNGILGRVYKDRYLRARDAGRSDEARGALRRAIDAYLAGFEADFRDAYPGINVLTLMEIAEPPDPRRTDLLPVVRYAVQRRTAQKDAADYWDHATLLELGFLAGDRDAAADALADALACQPKGWMAESTLANLRMIEEARQARATPTSWFATTVEAPLAQAAAG
ncbi:MAG: TRAFs-binding domain-containing protein [Planctomycetota bacterium]